MEVGVGNRATMQSSTTVQKRDSDNLSSTNSNNIAKERAQSVNEIVKEESEKKSVESLKKELQALSEDLNKEMSSLNMDVKFGFSDDIESMYVSVWEKDSDKLIRKIPSEEAMELMKKMREVVGIIFDKKG